MQARAAGSPKTGRLILWTTLSFFSAAAPAQAQDYQVRDYFGGIGMIDMPSARMAPDGELSIGASAFENTQRYSLGFQLTPWLETSFRYSGISHFQEAYPVYWDRSFAAKIRLWDETEFFPATAIGINDLAGTGIYSSEYIVASKRAGPLDLSIGLGWGRLGEANGFTNPLGEIFPSFRVRKSSVGEGGDFNLDQYFHGPTAAIFGGIVWRTPLEHLSLIAEYSSDRYEQETQSGTFRPQNQINLGASYEIADGTMVGLTWLYGRSIGGDIFFQLDPTHPRYEAKLGPAPLQIVARTTEEQQQALQMLLRHSHGIEAFARVETGRAEFVDALWQPSIQNAELRGQSLILTATGDLGRRCIAAAQLSQIFDGSIKSVIVHGDGASSVQCITGNATEPAYQGLLMSDGQMEASLPQQSPTPPQVINAAGSDTDAAMQAVRVDARRQQIQIQAIAITMNTAIVYYNNTHYFSEIDVLDRLTRIMMKDTPPDIEKFQLIAIVRGVPQQEFDILRGPEERKATQSDDLKMISEVNGTSILPPSMQNPVLAEADRHSYPRFSWNIYPQLRQELFDPANPFAIELAAAASGSFEPRPGLSFNGEVETSLFDNFNLERLSNSTLPHVRSDFVEYFAQGKTGIGLLDAEFRFRLEPTIFATFRAGYLESMFAGGGGEVLWRPEGQRWALGAEAYEVWQRGFDRLFDLQDYHVFTGHVSLYYDSPWYNLNFMISAGQYLAGDRGLTFQMTRRFLTGVEVGAFFTKTNVSSAQFGEGSFDKGIIIRIPLGWALPIETQGEWAVDIRPVQRDGGQRLLNDASLYSETQRTSEAEYRAQ